ncbi:MAG: ribosome maturation factor RimP [Sphingomonadales bacterium]
MPSPLEDKLARLLEPAIEGLGFELVRISVQGTGKPTIQVMAERPDRTMVVEDCAKLSREISTVMEVEDPISSEYVLEVSSPGIDRPLTRLKDFEDFKGFDARVTTRDLVDGQRRFKGKLLGVSGEIITLKTQEGEKELEFKSIEKAKLVLTDALVAASLKGH